MKDCILVTVSALLSGVLATFVTLWWQTKAECKRRRYEIFAGLMGRRFALPSESSVSLMNMIDVVFYKDVDVRNKYAEFLAETNKPENGSRDIEEKHLKLLEAMAVALGYTNIQWDTIKHTYFPVGLAEKYRDEDALMKLQIQNLAPQVALKPTNAVADL